MPASVKKNIAKRLMILITPLGDEQRVNGLLDGMEIPIYFQMSGFGTPSPETLDARDRLITFAMIPKSSAQAVFSNINDELSLSQRGRGMAVTVPITGMQDLIHRMVESRGGSANVDESEQKGQDGTMEQDTYSMIIVAANTGYSDQIINVAQEAGAGGGTVIKGQRRGSKSATNFLGVAAQDEQEFVMIAVRQEDREGVMAAITGAFGLNSKAHGIILSLPVEDAMGLTEP